MSNSVTTHPTAIAVFRRTPIAKRDRQLASLTAPQLAAFAGRVALEASPIPVSFIDAVVYGTSRLAGQGPNPAREFGNLSGIPWSIPAHTVSSACSSGIDAVLCAMRMIALGEARAVLVGSAESMSNTPRALFVDHDYHNSARYEDLHHLDGLRCPHTGSIMAEIAETLAVQRNIMRNSCDELAVRSHKLYSANRTLHECSIVPVETNAGLVERDKLPRGDDELHRVPALPPVYGAGGILTAATISALADGGAAAVFCRPDLLPDAPHVRGFVRVAGEPSDACIMPVRATKKLCARYGLSLADFDTIEISEGFASQVIACCDDLLLDIGRVNTFGSALAIGHPTGMSGLRTIGLVADAIRQNSSSNALVALPVSGGLGIALHVSRGSNG